MSNRSLGARVEEQLAQAVASGRLPASVHEKAEHLLTRLQKPVRVALMGHPGAGKTTLLNLLLGTMAISNTAPLPTFQLLYGEEEKTVCTLADGTKKTLPHADADKVAALSPAYVEMFLPLPALGKISILEVVAPDDPTALARASGWASKRCEVALWCTQTFDRHEQAAWAPMPDILKDHAFLMLTKADFLEANGMMDNTMDAIRAVASDEFSQIMPIATKRAIAARRPNGTVDKDLMRSSGGLALISAVLKQVEMGRQSAVDMADILLHQHADYLKSDEPKPEKGPVAAESPKQEPAEPEKVAATTVAEAETPEPVATPKVAEVSEASEEPNVVTLRPASREAYEAAVSYIVKESHALIDLAEKAGDAAPSKIIAKAVEHLQWLSDHLNDNGDDADAALQAARDAAFDAADLVQLMQMEKRDSAAVEALSLLLQLKHELQADLAA